MKQITVSALNTISDKANGDVYRSTNGQPEFLVFGREAEGSSTARYTTILDLPEQSQNEGPTRWRFVVGIELDDGHEAEFEDWYNVEHLPSLARVPGVRRAVRFRREGSDDDDTFPEYLALYDIEEPEIARNPDWKAAVETPWTVKMRPHFTARWRACYERVSE